MRSEISDLIPRAESVSRQIRAWADSLQNGDIAGQRHLTGTSRRAWDQSRRADAFLQKIQAVTREAARARGQPIDEPEEES